MKIYLTKKIDISFLPEAVEKYVYRFVIGMVVKAARKKLDFDKVRAEPDSMSVPDSDEEIKRVVED